MMMTMHDDDGKDGDHYYDGDVVDDDGGIDDA